MSRGAGGYSVINLSNLKTDNKEEKKVKARKPPKRKNAAPIFLKYTEHITDPYWHEVFDKCGYGRFPKGFSFFEGQLVYKKGAKAVSIPLTGEDTKDIVNFIEFFRKHGNLISPSEVEEVERKINENDEKKCVYEWSDHSKQGKLQLLTEYSHRLAKEKKVDYHPLLSILYIGLAFKYFDKDNVALKGLEIENINNLDFNEETKTFFFNESKKRGENKANASVKKNKRFTII
jgi:hypothetical protein